MLDAFIVFVQTLNVFVFLYPCVMAYVWIVGALLYYWVRERPFIDPAHPPTLPQYPFVSVLVPCHNEAENIEETFGQLMDLDYPAYEVLAVNDGSRDNTAELLDQLAQRHPRLRVMHLRQNQGKAMALTCAAHVARGEYLVCIDGDALLHPHALHWFVHGLEQWPGIGALTGNPRIRTRSSLLGKLQVGEFSSIIGLIKRAQRAYGRLFTVSGVVCAFRKRALHDIGYWASDTITEDIDVSWRLQLRGWYVLYEPHALCWILMPETLRGLWRQRLRWAQGGAENAVRNLRHFLRRPFSGLGPIYVDYCLSIFWAYAVAFTFVLWFLAYIPGVHLPVQGGGVIPESWGLVLCLTFLLQAAISMWLDGKYERGLRRTYFWMIWYPLVYWMLIWATALVGFPKGALRRRPRRARWQSPDRGVRA
jgi:biofilm PGA synthesis N-glycosyltransferase PgaC